MRTLMVAAMVAALAGTATAQVKYMAVVETEITAQSGAAAKDGSGTLTDGRDGKRYKTVVIGGKRWMGENLNYKAMNGNSWCYNNESSNCNKYGRLYDWKTAKMVCPVDWHLPSRQEWNDLEKASGGRKAVKNLKAKSDWNDYGKNSGNGTDNYGFSALPGGLRSYSESSFDGVGDCGYWWAATENDAGYAYGLNMYYDGGGHVDGGYYDDNDKGFGFSVRCVGD